MCLTFFIQNPCAQRKSIKLVIGFNRQQKLHRQTLPFDKFSDDPNIFGGRDMVSKGTWLGINIQTALLVFLTNYDTYPPRFGYSRGKLMLQLLATSLIPKERRQDSDQIIKEKLTEILAKGSSISPCNIVVYNIRSSNIHYICTQIQKKVPIILNSSIVYGLCNSDIFTIWPKTEYGLQIFKQLISKIGQKQSQIIINEMSELFKDKKRFSEKDQDQSSIFVEPYFNHAEQAMRMTKSSFFGIFEQKEDHIELQYKEVSYSENLQEKVIKNVLIIDK